MAREKQPLTSGEWKVYAHDGAQAWLNASIASSQDAERGPLYRTISVEFYRDGVQLIGCDGTMLFRTWAPFSDIGDFDAPQPEYDATPEDSVTVFDEEKFALGFMRTLLAATSGDNERIIELTLSIDQVEEEQAALDGMGEYVLTLQALGQRLSCKLYDGPYPNWRELQFGLPAEELVDGMTLAPRIFAAAGKLKGVSGVDCEFRGAERAIAWRSTPGSAPCCGLLMPMRRPTDRQRAKEEDAEQVEHE